MWCWEDQGTQRKGNTWSRHGNASGTVQTYICTRGQVACFKDKMQFKKQAVLWVPFLVEFLRRTKDGRLLDDSDVQTHICEPQLYAELVAKRLRTRFRTECFKELYVIRIHLPSLEI